MHTLLGTIIRAHKLSQEECFFWAVHQQAETNLIVLLNGKKTGFEFKWTDAPKLTKSINTACDILQLDKCYVIYPGQKSYQLSEKIFVVSLKQYLLNLKK